MTRLSIEEMSISSPETIIALKKGQFANIYDLIL